MIITDRPFKLVGKLVLDDKVENGAGGLLPLKYKDNEIKIMLRITA